METDERIAALEQRVTQLELLVAEMQEKLNRPVAKLSSDDLKQAMAGAKTEEEPQTLFLPAPTAEGRFESHSDSKDAQSVFELTTKDGRNGSFELIDTPEVVAKMADKAASRLLPACKVMGNARLKPRRIYTVAEGKATCDAGGWRVLKKAVVAFES